MSRKSRRPKKGGKRLKPIVLPSPVAPVSQPVDATEDEIQKLRGQVVLLDERLEEARQQQASDTKRILLGVIECVDAFERIFGNIQAKRDHVTTQMEEAWIKNFRTILKLLNKKVLAEFGAIPIQDHDGFFDPHWHQVHERVADTSKPDGAIVDVIEKGYAWKDQVLRKTLVVVAYSGDVSTLPEKSPDPVLTPNGASD